MANWHARVRALGDIAVQLHAVITLGGIVLAVFAAAVAVMSYVLNSIAGLSQYGWGLPVVVAIGIVLASLLVLSLIILAAAAAYRWWCLYRYPDLYRQVIRDKTGVQLGTPELRVVPEMADSAPWKAEIDKLGSALEKYVDSLRSDLIASLAEALKATPWKADIDRLNELGVAQHEVSESFRVQFKGLQDTLTQISTKSRSDYLNLERLFRYLIDAIRARDAEAQVKDAEKLVCSLGEKLILGTGYTDSKAWLADYQIWHNNLAAIDQAVISLGVEGYTAFLNIQRRDLEKCAEMPPKEKGADEIIIPYKTVCLAQRRYRDGREQLFRYFAVKAALPG